MSLFTSIFTGPVLPASILLGMLLLWSLLALLGTVDIDIPGGDLSIDGDVKVDMQLETTGLGLLVSRWLNIGRVPLLLWLGAFSVIWWFVSAMLWVLVDSKLFSPPGWTWSSLLIVKNLAISIPLTKLITNPMRGWFETEHISAHSIVGQECSISSLQATPEFGQVKLKTDGSPLLLNVRTDGPHLARGARVWITHYDSKRRVYVVSSTGTDSAS